MSRWLTRSIYTLIWFHVKETLQILINVSVPICEMYCGCYVVQNDPYIFCSALMTSIYLLFNERVWTLHDNGPEFWYGRENSQCTSRQMSLPSSHFSSVPPPIKSEDSVRVVQSPSTLYCNVFYCAHTSISDQVCTTAWYITFSYSNEESQHVCGALSVYIAINNQTYNLPESVNTSEQ